MKKFLMIILLAVIPSNAFAGLVWTNLLTDWTMHLDNGVVYVNSALMPANCTNSRAQINMSDTAYDNAQYAFVLSAYKTAKPIRVVIDDTATICVISGLQDK